MTPMTRRMAAGIAAALCVTLAGCSGADTTKKADGAAEGDAQTLNVLMVGNPQMKDLAEMVPAHFEKDTGIKVNLTILPENELRDKVAQDVATQAGQYDVVTIGAYEASTWTANDWLVNMQDMAEKDTAFDEADILPAMKNVLSKDGDMYAIPFYGESAFTMYRKDIFEKYNLTMPAEPTWDDISNLAKELNNKEPGMSGICLRGLPGWGENMAVMGAMFNSFGGGFFDKDWNVKVGSEETKKAVNWYVDTVKNYGEAGPAQAGFTECLNNFAQGKSAMWYDATSAANSVEDPKSSTVAGKVGYAAPPKGEKAAGWVWAWAWGMPKTTKHQDTAWKFISWASSKEYEKLVGAEKGWTRVPDGKRASTFDIPEYKEASAAYSEQMQKALAGSDPAKCSVFDTPAAGCQYLAIPEFADLGTKIGQEMSAALSGQKTADEAVAASVKLAEEVAAKKK